MATTKATRQLLPLETVVGSAVRRLRTGKGMSQEDLARRLAGVGLNWNRSTVNKLEHGKRLGLTLAQSLLLSLALGVTPAELCETKGMINLDDGVRVDSSVVAKLLKGKPGHWEPLLQFDVPATRQRTGTTAQRRSGRAARNPGVDLDSVLSATAGDVERRVAEKLGVDPEDVALAAQRLWGQGLTQKRDQLVAEAAPDVTIPPRGVRGRVTRRLVDQLADAMKENR